MNSCSSNYGIDVLDLQGLEGSKMGNKKCNTSCLCSSDYEVAVSEGKGKRNFFSCNTYNPWEHKEKNLGSWKLEME